MPFSYADVRGCVQHYLLRVEGRTTRILDVGSGAGAYGDVLGRHFRIDAVEAWKPYIEQFSLKERYREVVHADVRDLPEASFANKVVILGDVLEHLPIADARCLLRRMRCAGARRVVVVVPYEYEQGAEHTDVQAFGNPFEVHHQPDLTHRVVVARYPGLKSLARTARVGAYVWVRSDVRRRDRVYELG